MAKADRSIDPRLLRCAKEEFLRRGFEKASLKEICEQAQVTTGALYKRYTGKEELFCAVVESCVADLQGILDQKTQQSPAQMSDGELIRAWDMDESYMLWWFQFLYERHDDFTLLLRCSEGTRYMYFEHDWVQQMTDATYAFYEEAYRRGLATVRISEAEMHVLLSAFWTTIYEPFIHDFTWEQILEHNRIVCRLFHWNEVLGFKET
ncbi:MAG: TetR/AcrR family transcriptional regulator [Eubacteriales bacterium]|nr:TetR/AcrR family transcriptional regulator [Eubacteriales bacterium]